ncbi:MAG: cobaltochelatase subunit CobN, partial [Methylococcales bacterium]
MKNFFLLKFLVLILLLFSTLPAAAQVKIGILSTQFVLEQKFKLMEQAAKKQGVELAWTQVDRDGEAGVKRVMENATMVIIDAPRNEDITLIERVSAGAMTNNALPTLNINMMNPPNRLKPVNLEAAVAERLFDYYAGGTPINHERLFQYLNALLTGGDVSKIAEPMKLPNGGIYHPKFAELIFDNLPAYLTWWETQTGKKWQNNPVIAMESSSSHISDGQLRMLDETIDSIEKAGGVPLIFYRATRVGQAGGRPTAPAGSGRPEASGEKPRGRPESAPTTATDRGFPNPKAAQSIAVNEPLLTMDGKIIANVLMVNTFLGMNPD